MYEGLKCMAHGIRVAKNFRRRMRCRGAQGVGQQQLSANAPQEPPK